MAVYWIDPYLESSGQTSGIHGTTGSGSGTYASPWKWSQMYQNSNSNVYGTIVNGDEIRIKGQTFGSYTFTSHNWTSITTGSQGGVTWVRRYSTGWHSDSLQYALRLTTGEKIWKAMSDNYSQFDTAGYVSTWRECYPQLQGSTTSTGYYVLDSSWNMKQTDLRTGNGNSTYFNWAVNYSNPNIGLTTVNGLKITAGWVSETSQTDGVTILNFDSTSTDYGGWGYGCQYQYGRRGCGYIHWDCADTLVMGHTPDGSQLRMAGHTIKVDTFKNPNYNSYDMEVETSGDVYFRQWGSGGYNEAFIRMDPNEYNSEIKYDDSVYQHEFEVREWTGGYINRVYCYFPQDSNLSNYSNTSAREIHCKLKHFDGYNGWYIHDYDSNYGGKLTMEFLDGYHHVKDGDGFNLEQWGSNKTVVETIGQVAAEDWWPAGNPDAVEENSGYGGLGAQPSYNEEWYDISNSSYPLNSSTTSIFGEATINQAYRSWSTHLVMQGSDTLENMEGNPLSFTQSSGWYQPYKVTVFRNTTDQRPLTLAMPGNNNSGPSIAHFNSPANSNKLVWHFFNNNNGYTYSDGFALQIPDYSANNLRLNGDFTHTTGLGVTFTLIVYFIPVDQDTGYTFQNYTDKFGPYSSPTTTATTAVFAETITTSALSSANPKTMWVAVQIAKSNNVVGNVIFNQLDLTQI